MKKVKANGLDYSNLNDLLLDRDIVVGIVGGATLGGIVRLIDDEHLILVNEPTSRLDIETKNVHNIIKVEHITFIQFKTDSNMDR